MLTILSEHGNVYPLVDHSEWALFECQACTNLNDQAVPTNAYKMQDLDSRDSKYAFS